MIFFVLLPLGELPEWSIGADSKSVEPFGVPGVRIPHSPQAKKQRRMALFFCVQTLSGRLRTRERRRTKKRHCGARAFSLARMPAAAKGYAIPKPFMKYE